MFDAPDSCDPRHTGDQHETLDVEHGSACIPLKYDTY
jgi:hypothetical protein